MSVHPQLIAALAMAADVPGTGHTNTGEASNNPTARQERREKAAAEKAGRAALLVPKAEAKRQRKAARRLAELRGGEADTPDATPVGTPTGGRDADG